MKPSISRLRVVCACSVCTRIPVCPSASVHVRVWMYFRRLVLVVCPSVYLCLYLSVYLSIYLLSNGLLIFYIYRSTDIHIHIYIYVNIHILYVCMYPYLSLSICLLFSVCLYFSSSNLLVSLSAQLSIDLCLSSV